MGKVKKERRVPNKLSDMDKTIHQIKLELNRALSIHNDEQAIKRIIRKAQDLL